jgi:hypothetical protein
VLIRPLQRVYDPFVRIIGLVGNNRPRFQVVHKRVRALQVVSLPRRQVKACRVAQSIGRRLDFCGQSALAAFNRFFWAPFLRQLRSLRTASCHPMDAPHLPTAPSFRAESAQGYTRPSGAGGIWFWVSFVAYGKTPSPPSCVTIGATHSR